MKGHEVDFRFLGEFMRTVQDLTFAVAQVFAGRPTAAAPVQRNLVAENRLMVTGFRGGSFVIQARFKRPEELGQLVENTSKQVFEGVTDLLADDAQAARIVELTAHARVRKHYRLLLDLLAKNDASVTVRSRTRPFGRRVTASSARERLEWLELSETSEEITEMDGELVGGSIEKDRFELKVGDEVVAGEISEPVREQLRTLKLGDRVHAKLRITRSEHEEGLVEPTVKYLAVDIAVSGRE